MANRKHYPVTRFLCALLVIFALSAHTAHVLPSDDPRVDPIPQLDFDRSAKSILARIQFTSTNEVYVDGVEVAYGRAHGHVGDPPLLRLDLLDKDGTLVEQLNAWDPRWVFVENPDGTESRVIDPEALGEFILPFSLLHRRMNVVEARTGHELISVELEDTVRAFCEQNRDDPECNVPPVAHIEPIEVAECAQDEGALVTVDGGGSTDYDGDELFCTWTSQECLFADSMACVTIATCPLGDSSVTLVVHDEHWESDPEVGVVTVADTIPPAIDCPAAVSLMGANCEGEAAVPHETASVSDMCGGTILVEANPPKVGCFQTEPVTLTAVDGSGNSAQCSIAVSVECRDPASHGYWHRQCLGAGLIKPGKKGRGPRSPLEPNFLQTLVPEVDLRLQSTVYESRTCEDGIYADPPRDSCEKAIEEYTALLLNLASARLTGRCSIDVTQAGCQAANMDDLLVELAALINSGDERSCKRAASCAAGLNENEFVISR